MKERRWAASEPNWFLLMFFSWRRMTKRKFRRGLERLRQAMAALWSDSNWSVTETEETRLWDWRAVSQSITWPDLWVGSRTAEKGCCCCCWILGGCGLYHWNSRVEMETKIAQQERFARAEAVVVKESRKFSYDCASVIVDWALIWFGCNETRKTQVWLHFIACHEKSKSRINKTKLFMQSFEISKNVFMGLMNMYTQWKWIVIYFVESDYYTKRWSEKNTKTDWHA